MSSRANDYVPISCEFHDVLEAHAMTRKRVQLRFRDIGGNVQERVASLTDVFSREGSEYVSISTGETVRLDRLISVGSERLPGA